MKLKEQLIEMGIPEEQVQKIIDEVVDGNFIPKARFNEVNEELKSLKKSVSDRDKQLEELKKSAGENTELTQQIAKLQKANEERQKDYEREIAAGQQHLLF